MALVSTSAKARIKELSRSYKFAESAVGREKGFQLHLNLGLRRRAIGNLANDRRIQRQVHLGVKISSGLEKRTLNLVLSPELGPKLSRQ